MAGAPFNVNAKTELFLEKEIPKLEVLVLANDVYRVPKPDDDHGYAFTGLMASTTVNAISFPFLENEQPFLATLFENDAALEYRVPKPDDDHAYTF